MTTDYEEVSHSYDTRYARHGYPGIWRSVRDFVGDPKARVLEVGCGTGHWLVQLAAHGHAVAGVEPAVGMLEKARDKLPDARLLRASAEHLPLADASFDRVLMINAVHHFRDRARAFCEARRVLTSGGGVLSIALDPSAGRDSWCIYDYFEGTRERDCERFPTSEALRCELSAAGFSRRQSYVAEYIDHELPVREALSSGALDRHVTSQLSELSDERYRAGIAAIEADADAAEARGDVLTLHARLHLFATVGWVD